MSYFFPPQNSIASKRYGTMCRYMKQYGYEPYVLTTNALGDLEIPIFKENIMRIGYNIYYNGNINIHKPLKLKFFQFIIIKILEIGKIQIRSVDKLSYSWTNEVKSKFWKKYNSEFKPDIIIGTYGPIGNIMVAKFLSKKLGVPWIAEIRDLISQYSADIVEGYKKSKYLDFIVEKHLLSSSKSIITVTNGFKRVLNKIYNKKIKVIYNGWDNFLQKSSEIELDDSDNSDYLYYAGSFYEHRLNSLYILIDALKELNKQRCIKLIIRSMGPDELNKKIISYIKKLDMSEKIVIKKPCNSSTIQMEQRNSMINIVLSDINTNNFFLTSTIPGKLMELINCNSPILAIATPNSEIAYILKSTNKGIVSSSKKEIIDYIQRYKYLKYIGNKKNIYKYSRKFQTKKLCQFLDKNI